MTTHILCLPSNVISFDMPIHRRQRLFAWRTLTATIQFRNNANELAYISNIWWFMNVITNKYDISHVVPHVNSTFFLFYSLAREIRERGKEAEKKLHFLDISLKNSNVFSLYLIFSSGHVNIYIDLFIAEKWKKVDNFNWTLLKKTRYNAWPKREHILWITLEKFLRQRHKNNAKNVKKNHSHIWILEATWSTLNFIVIVCYGFFRDFKSIRKLRMKIDYTHSLNLIYNFLFLRSGRMAIALFGITLCLCTLKIYKRNRICFFFSLCLSWPKRPMYRIILWNYTKIFSSFSKNNFKKMATCLLIINLCAILIAISRKRERERVSKRKESANERAPDLVAWKCQWQWLSGGFCVVLYAIAVKVSVGERLEEEIV